MRSARSPNARIFFVRGTCRISGKLQFFRANFAQNLLHLDAGLARYLALERTPTQKKELHRRSAVRATTLAEFTQLFCARRAEIFSGTLQFFRASWAQNLRDPDAGRFPFRI